jgi:ribosomal protein L12E/L44/L45/RPP1/RPP2
MQVLGRRLLSAVGEACEQQRANLLLHVRELVLRGAPLSYTTPSSTTPSSSSASKQQQQEEQEQEQEQEERMRELAAHYSVPELLASLADEAVTPDLAGGRPQGLLGGLEGGGLWGPAFAGGGRAGTLQVF